MLDKYLDPGLLLVRQSLAKRQKPVKSEMVSFRKEP